KEKEQKRLSHHPQQQKSLAVLYLVKNQIKYSSYSRITLKGSLQQVKPKQYKKKNFHLKHIKWKRITHLLKKLQIVIQKRLRRKRYMYVWVDQFQSWNGLMKFITSQSCCLVLERQRTGFIHQMKAFHWIVMIKGWKH